MFGFAYGFGLGNSGTGMPSFQAFSNVAVAGEGAAVIIDVAANDVAPVYGLNLASIIIVSDASHGTTQDNGDGTITYTHDDSENFSDSFTYTIQNNNGDTSNVATVTISITGVNDNAPVFSSSTTANVDERTTLVHTVTATDVDAGSVATFSIAGTGADDAKFQITTSGVLSFINAPDFEVPTDVGTNNVYNVDVEVDDGVFQVIQSIAVTVDDVAENPAASNDAYTVDEGSTSVLSVLSNDTDPQSDIDVTTVAIVANGANGIATPNANGTITYIHNGSETVSDTFTYTVDDDEGNTSNTATVSLTVTPQNDAPNAVNDVFTVTEATTTNIDLATNDTDPDNALDLTSIVIVGQPSEGSIVVQNDGTVDYTNTSSGASTDSFTYTINDVSGATSNTATVNITVDAAISEILSIWPDDGSAHVPANIAIDYPDNLASPKAWSNDGGTNEILVDLPDGCIVEDGYQVVENLIPVAQGRFIGWGKFGAGFVTNNPDGSVTIVTTSSERSFVTATLNVKVGINYLMFAISNIGAAHDFARTLVLVIGGTAISSEIINPSTIDNTDKVVVYKFDVTTAGTLSIRLGTGCTNAFSSDATYSQPSVYSVRGLTNQNPPPYVSVGVESAPEYHGAYVDGLAYLTEENDGTTVDANGVVTRGANTLIPASQRRGVYCAGGYNQELTVTQDMTVAESPSLSAGDYTVKVEGAGSIAVTGGATGTATEASPFSFNLGSTQTVTFTPSGTVTRANVTDTDVAARFTEKSSVAATNDIQVTHADYSFSNTTKKVEIEFTPAHDFADLPATEKSIISVNDSATTGLLYISSDLKLATTDGTNVAKATTPILAGVTYKITIEQDGTNLTIAINDVVEATTSWDGSWNIGTLMRICQGFDTGGNVKILEVFN